MPQIPAGWKETTLGEMIDYIVDNRGKTPPITDIGYELLEVNAVSATSRIPDYSKVSKFISAETFHNWFRKGTLKKWDILVPTVGTIGNVAYSQNNRWAIAQNLVALRVNDESNSLFWYYLLKSPYVQKSLLNLDIGWVQPSIKVPHLLNLPIHLPPLPEQQAIAAVLSSFDDKIELLRAENQTLEQMGQELFKERFGKWKVGDDLPEGWRVGKLGEEFDVSIGRTPPRAESEWFSNKPIGKKWISIKDMVNSWIYIFNTSEFLTDEAIAKFNIPIIPNNTTILSFKMTVGKLAITTEDMLSNEAIAHFKLKSNSLLSSEFIYCYLSNLDFNSLWSTSSIVTAINSTIIKELSCIIPDQETLSKFDLVIKPLFNKIRANSEQIQTLSSTRDQLLPKLMSGEVRVEF